MTRKKVPEKEKKKPKIYFSVNGKRIISGKFDIFVFELENDLSCRGWQNEYPKKINIRLEKK